MKSLAKSKPAVGSRTEASEVVFKIISYTFTTIFALCCIYPLIYALSSSISGRVAVDTGKVILWPIDVQFDAFLEVVKLKSFWTTYCNSIFLTLFGTLYCMLLSICGAYTLSKKKLFGNKVLNLLLVFTMWFSAGVVPMYLNYKDTGRILQSMGITDEKWLVVLAMGMSAYNIILLRNAFESVPKEIDEAAKVDGADDFQILSKIFVPMSKATVATVSLFYGISRWNGYFWSMKVVANETYFPLQVMIQNQISAYNEAMSEGGTLLTASYSAQSLIFVMIIFSIIPILIIYPFIQKYFATGVNVGGVKE